MRESSQKPDTDANALMDRRDQAAVVVAVVVAGLTLPFSSGAVEGGVNRVKMLKRQTYGRAGFDLLRKRILLAG